MDVIAEILNTEKMAEEKLKLAEEESARLLEECEKESRQIEEASAENIKSYKLSKQAQADKEIMSAEDVIKAEEKKKIDELDSIYDNNHEKWENDIVDRIISG